MSDETINQLRAERDAAIARANKLAGEGDLLRDVVAALKIDLSEARRLAGEVEKERDAERIAHRFANSALDTAYGDIRRVSESRDHARFMAHGWRRLAERTAGLLTELDKHHEWHHEQWKKTAEERDAATQRANAADIVARAEAAERLDERLLALLTTPAEQSIHGIVVRNIQRVPSSDTDAGYSFTFEAKRGAEWIAYGPVCCGNWSVRSSLPADLAARLLPSHPPTNDTVPIGWWALDREVGPLDRMESAEQREKGVGE